MKRIFITDSGRFLEAQGADHQPDASRVSIQHLPDRRPALDIERQLTSPGLQVLLHWRGRKSFRAIKHRVPLLKTDWAGPTPWRKRKGFSGRQSGKLSASLFHA